MMRSETYDMSEPNVRRIFLRRSAHDTLTKFLTLSDMKDRDMVERTHKITLVDGAQRYVIKDSTGETVH